MSIHMVGVDYTKADVDIRSRFAFTKKECREAMACWKEQPGISGVVILSTCNRTEVWADMDEEKAAGAVRDLAELMEAEKAAAEEAAAAEAEKPAAGETEAGFDVKAEAGGIKAAGKKKEVVQTGSSGEEESEKKRNAGADKIRGQREETAAETVPEKEEQAERADSREGGESAGVADGGNTAEAADAPFEDACSEYLYLLLCREKRQSPSGCRPYMAARSGEEAVRHLFRVAAGLRSQILAEDQIAAQVNEALALSRDNYTTDSVLEVLFRRAVTAAKRVKTEVKFSRADATAVDAAVRLLKEHRFSFEGAACLVVGNGEMGKLAALTLKKIGADVTVTVRQYKSGEVQIPQGCARINYGERGNYLPQCDLVVSATASPNLTFTKEFVRDSRICRRDWPLIFVDLAVPRDIDPAVRELPGVTLYTLDDFRPDGIPEPMRESVEQAEKILDEETADFYGWLEGREIAPRIQAVGECAADDFHFRVRKEIGGLPLPEGQKAELAEKTDAAAGKVAAKLLFDLRDILSEEQFLNCLQRLEEKYRS